VAQTPLSGAAAYCTAAQFVEFFDVRTAGDYLSDTGQRLPPPDVIASTILATLLKTASGRMESQLVRGGRYTPDDLNALTNNGVAFLRQLVAGLTAFYLWMRRPTKFMKDDMPGISKIALEDVDMLGNGLEILPFSEAAKAGRINHHVTTAAEVNDRGLAEVGARRFFGRRNDQSGLQRPRSSY